MLVYFINQRYCKHVMYMHKLHSCWFSAINTKNSILLGDAYTESSFSKFFKIVETYLVNKLKNKVSPAWRCPHLLQHLEQLSKLLYKWGLANFSFLSVISWSVHDGRLRFWKKIWGWNFALSMNYTWCTL